MNLNTMGNKTERENLLLLAEFQLRLNYWKKQVAQWEKAVEEKLLENHA